MAVSLAFGQETATTATTTSDATATEEDEEIVELTPFQVDATKDVGYYAENTLAGSRINTNIGDLAASITVVTKQQMEDTASVDINDIFKYEANTEGSGSYSPSIIDRNTMKDSVAGYSFGNNGDTTTNAQSNRLRGLGSPDAAINNFSTNNRIPFDSYNIQSVEISRGPNSFLFGLGTPAGVVNTNTAQASLTKDSNQVQVRLDHNASFRSSFQFNRVLIKDKLAIYGALLYDDRQFERKPSSDKYRRQYAAINFQPFKNTSIRGFFENFSNDANRPNSFTPRDQISYWMEAGRPVYDAVERTITVLDTGATTGPYVRYSASPGYTTAINILGTSAISNTSSTQYVAGIVADDVGRPVRMIDEGVSTLFIQRQPQFYREEQTYPWSTLYTPTSLGWESGAYAYSLVDRMWTSSNFPITPTTTIDGVTYTYGSWNWAGITNKSIYDWTKYNTLGSNFANVDAQNINLQVDQRLFSNLYLSLAWLRQDIDEVDNYTMSQLQGATMAVDTNIYLPDGSANPYYGLPFMFEGSGGGLDTFKSPQVDDNYRAMATYELDFTRNDGWSRWLGRHRLVGTWQKQDTDKSVERWRMNFVDGDYLTKMLYTRNLAAPAQALWSATATMRHYYMASPGDPMGVVTKSVGYYGNRGWNEPYTSTMRVWNQRTYEWEDAEIVERIVFSSAGSYKTDRSVDGVQLAMQSDFLDNRLVTTVGWRDDTSKARVTSTGIIYDKDGNKLEDAPGNDWLYLDGYTGEINYDNVMNRWTPWQEYSLATTSYSVAFRPFRDFGPVNRNNSLFSQFVRGLTLYYNSGENFNPPTTYQKDYFGQDLELPQGKTKDWGVGFNLLDNKLVARLTWYETDNQNERTSQAGTLLTRLAYSDTTTGLAWASCVLRIQKALAAGRTLNEDTEDPDSIFADSDWNDTNGPWDISSEEDQRTLYDMIELPYKYYDGITGLSATQESKAKGTEVQVTYNPTPSLTLKFTGSKNESRYYDVAPQYDEWLAVRLPVWESLTSEIPDFVDPNNSRQYSLGQFWTGYGYHTAARIENTDGNTSAQAYFNNVVASQVANAKALEGSVSPLSRKYHASLVTNYTIREGSYKGNSFGGSVRWESKAAIGYYGKVGDPTQPTVINVADITRPIWGDNGNFYVDLWFAHTRRIFDDKVRMKIQINCNNALENGRLLATAVNYDGSPWAYRIIDPRQWIITTSFDF